MAGVGCGRISRGPRWAVTIFRLTRQVCRASRREPGRVFQTVVQPASGMVSTWESCSRDLLGRRHVREHRQLMAAGGHLRRGRRSTNEHCFSRSGSSSETSRGLGRSVAEEALASGRKVRGPPVGARRPVRRLRLGTGKQSRSARRRRATTRHPPINLLARIPNHAAQ